jgi:hypothetical protein
MRPLAPGVVIATLAVAAVAHAGPPPIAIALCGESKLEVVAATSEGRGELRATVATAASKWTFTAKIDDVRIGTRARTLSIEGLATQDGAPARGKDAPPAMSIDLLTDDRKALLRHASEGGADAEYVADLAKCSFPREADVALATFVRAPAEPTGCAPQLVRDTYRKQVDQAGKLADADADREAQALCADHQKTLEARDKLEQAVTDRMARDRIAARGAALFHVMDAWDKAWARVDTCLNAAPSKAQGVAALHDAEARQRACYHQVAGKP